MRLLYRILTEDKNREVVEDLTTRAFAGFTVLSAKGYWRGQRENSLIIEVETDDQKGIRELALNIKRVNNQQSVMVQRLENTAEFV